MKLDETEQIPVGMMDRISEKLAAHTAARKKRAVRKTLMIATALTMLLPISVYAVANMDWGWFQGIELAAKSGKSIKLDQEFNFENNRVLFKNAVWQGDTLLISYSIPEGSLLPAQTVLLNERGEVISHGGGGQYDGKRNGTLKLDYEMNKLSGENTYLAVYTLDNMKSSTPEDSLYEFDLLLDKSLLTGGTAKIGREFNTPYGTLTLEEARSEKGRIFITYHFKEDSVFSELDNTDPKGVYAFHDVFPELYLKDTDGTIIHSNGRFSAPEGNSGEITFDGSMKNLDKPVKLALVCTEKAVNWKIPIPISNIPPEVIPLNKTVELDGGILKLENLILGSAGTSIDYQFVPDGNNNEIIDIQPEISMTANGATYDTEPGMSGLSGKATFPIPMDKNTLKDALFNTLIVKRTVAHPTTIQVEKGLPFPSIDLQGSKLKVVKMEVKDGKTTIELLLDDIRRKYQNVNVSIGTEDRFAAISSGDSMEFIDKNLEDRLNKNPAAITQNDVNQMIVKKTIELQGEYNKIQVNVESLVYMDVCKYEFKVK